MKKAQCSIEDRKPPIGDFIAAKASGIASSRGSTLQAECATI
jgi:hypothetical protein